MRSLAEPVQGHPVSPPEPRYEHLGRNSASRWWRPVVGTLIVAAALFGCALLVLLAANVLAAKIGMTVPLTMEQIYESPILSVVVMLVPVAVLLPVVLLTAVVIQRRKPGTLASVAGRLRWPWMLRCVGVALVAVAGGLGAQVIVYSATGLGSPITLGWQSWTSFLPLAGLIVLLVPFQAAAEEYVFRGWLIQAFGAYVRSPWPGIVVGSLIFMSLHGYTGWGMADVFLFGMLMAWLTVSTQGLEAAISMHVVNNLVAFLPPAAAGELDAAFRQGAVPWQSLAGSVVQLAIYGIWIRALAHGEREPGSVTEWPRLRIT